MATKLRLNRYGDQKKSDIVKLSLAHKVDAVSGWKPLFRTSDQSPLTLKFSSNVAPRPLRSSTISLSGTKEELHLCLFSAAPGENPKTLLSYEVFPAKQIPSATIFWPQSDPELPPLTTAVKLTERC